MSLFNELKRRNVFRVAIAYLIIAWLILQVGDTLAPALRLPEWVNTVLAFFLILGFPMALFFAWVFEFTPEGLKKETEIDRSGPASVATSSRKLNFLIIGTLILTVVFLLFDKANIGVDTDFPADTTHGPRVAVLPFDNLSGDNEQDYFSDGLSEDISTALSKFTDIRVIPASLTLAFRNTPDLGEVGDKLDAAYVIGGSVRLTPNAVRISARLIDVNTNTQLWGDTYDRELSAANLFDIQSDVAQRVVSTIADSSGVLSRVGQHQLVSQPTDSLEAYSCVLRGYRYLSVHTDENHLLARECLEQAVQLDPGYADAWAHLGYIYRDEYHHNRNLKPEPLGRAMSATRRAIELDASNPMARFAMSMTQFSLGNIDAGMAEGEKSIALNPNDATKLAAVALYYVHAGKTDRGVELARRAESLNPLPPNWFHMIYASAYYQSGEYDRALEALSEWNDDGVDVQWHLHKIAILGQTGKLSEANRELEKTYEIFPEFAEDPVREMRKYFLTDDTFNKYYEGLSKAGLKNKLPEETQTQ